MLDIFARKPDLIVHSEAPLNAEPPPDRLRSSFVTRAADFYIRSHGDMPALGPDHAVGITGQVARPFAVTVADLQARFRQRTVVATLQCAGNRRADLQQVRPTSGDPWAPGAIGNAEWTGVALADLLREAGAADEPGSHVAFEAVDLAENEGEADAPYGASIPLAKAMADEVLVVHTMNGALLPREHGAPLRVVVPGFAGVRSVKWLKRICVQAEPSQAFQQRRDYLLFPPAMRRETQDIDQGVIIEAMPLNAAICQPLPGAVLKPGRATVRGYAIASGRAVVRVDVSVDGGREWRQAELEDHGAAPWAWTLWHATLDLPAGDRELVVRAWDSAGQTQPADPDEVWNFKGYLCASWHRVRVRVRVEA